MNNSYNYNNNSYSSYSSQPPYPKDDYYKEEYQDGPNHTLGWIAAAFFIFLALLLPISKLCSNVCSKVRYIYQNWRVDWLGSYNNFGWLFEDAYPPTAQRTVAKVKIQQEACIVEFEKVPFDCLYRFKKTWYKKTSNDTGIALSSELCKISMAPQNYVAVLSKDCNVQVPATQRFKV